MRERLISALGIVVILALAFALCPRERRAQVQRRTIVGGLGLLGLFAVLLLATPVVRGFGAMSAAVERLLGFTYQGARFVFGALAEDHTAFGFVFAFRVLPTILFFSALMSVLYHLGLLPWVIERGGRLLSRALGVSGAESFSTVADVFVGQTEAPLAVKPYVARMTLSELNACMVAGFATTAGGVLAAYVAMLSSSVPGIAGHLLASSVMSAPAALVIAKLMLPESEQPETTGALRAEQPHDSVNVLDALVRGTLDGVRLAVNVAAMLIVFLAFTALLDALLAGTGALLGIELSLTRLLSWLFAPLAFVLGLPSGDVSKVATLLGQKTVFNEFVAYSQLGPLKDTLDPKSFTIATFALCGFANFSSIGIQIGGIGALAPERRHDLARLGLRAMLAGTFANFLTATIAGMLL